MTFGSPKQADDGVRRHRRTRNWYLGVCLASIVALGAVIGAIVLALDGGREPWSSPVLIGGAVVICLLLAAPVAVTALRAVHWHQQVRERLRDLAESRAAGRPTPPTPTWVPPGAGDPAAPSSHGGALAWRNVGITAAFLALFAFGITEGIKMSTDNRELLEHGTRVTGTVLSVQDKARSRWTISVAYPAGGTWHTAEIGLDTKRLILVRQAVTVIYDPADLARVRTPEDKNTSDVQLSLCLEPLGAGLAGIPFGALTAAGWIRRYRSVRRTGWHPASVVVSPVGQIFAEYFQGGRIELGGVVSIRRATRFAQEEPRRAWIGGEAEAMILLLPREGRKKPFVLPVRAQTPLMNAHRSAHRSRRRRR